MYKLLERRYKGLAVVEQTTDSYKKISSKYVFNTDPKMRTIKLYTSILPLPIMRP